MGKSCHFIVGDEGNAVIVKHVTFDMTKLNNPWNFEV